MSARFFQNGVDIGTSAGWGGYTSGGNNYVVRYDVTTNSGGASQITLYLNNIYSVGSSTRTGNGTFGFKISTDATAYTNARGIVPDSTSGTFYTNPSSYERSLTLTISGNYKPNTTYYLFVYCYTGIEWYTGWNCTNPTIATSGSYTPRESSIASISTPVKTQENVVITMNNPASLTHTAQFYYGSTLLATSSSFTTSLSYTCPRSWFNNNVSITEMSITVRVTNSEGGTSTGSFMLEADEGMKPSVTSSMVSVTYVNTGTSITGFIAGVSKAQVTFSNIDMSATAGAAIRQYSVTCQGVTTSQSGATITTDVITATTTLVCAVKDSRDRSGEYSVEITLTPYVPPTLTDIDVFRCDSEGTASQTGTHFRAKATSVFTSIKDENEQELNTPTITVALAQSGSSFSNVGTLTSGVQSDFSGLNQSYTYVVKLTVQDNIGRSQEYKTTLAYESWLLTFRASGEGAAIGMMASQDHEMQVPETWCFKAGNAEYASDGITLPSGSDITIGGVSITSFMFLSAHPVGSYFWSNSSVSPQTTYGGTWERVKDKFVYALGDTGDPGDTGGSSSYPAHAHNLSDAGGAAITLKYWNGDTYTETKSRIWRGKLSNAGNMPFDNGTLQNMEGGLPGVYTVTSSTPGVALYGTTDSVEAINTLPPYVKAYCWLRTA